ncbi:MAG: AbrB/MazE/SpoVT family DNA-binding domain-containing protein [Burkholderiales bacterium]
MELQVGKWGNSLAIRLPARFARELQVEEGSAVEAEVVSPGQMKLAGAPPFDKKAYLKRLRALHARMPMTEPVVEQMRRDARY